MTLTMNGVDTDESGSGYVTYDFVTWDHMIWVISRSESQFETNELFMNFESNIDQTGIEPAYFWHDN